ncbi:MULTISPECIES: PRC-barrel domain-containing protein [Rhodomicrobium]|uniref:PRC-barrel domain-containing protein n=1 Tax=Rhodomicrobium TaxID=1068 RepID=UPI000B4C1977|nr:MULTISPECIES: PRC-barrel domain-containing protein [Rhodomicrobium]
MSVNEVDIIVVDVKAVHRGFRVSGLLGISVENGKDEEIGTIDDLIVDRERVGRIAFAVIEVGGFLGIGGRLVAIEYDSLQIERGDDDFRVILPGATKEALKSLPAFEYAS